jgi:hypothetical protein
MIRNVRSTRGPVYVSVAHTRDQSIEIGAANRRDTWHLHLNIEQAEQLRAALDEAISEAKASA